MFLNQAAQVSRGQVERAGWLQGFNALGCVLHWIDLLVVRATSDAVAAACLLPLSWSLKAR